MRLNGDQIRQQYDDWDFSIEGRIRQANRIRLHALGNEVYLVDFICPLSQMRSIINADFTIFMDTKSESMYKDTDAMFERPEKCNFVITDFNYSIPEILNAISLELGLDTWQS